MFSSLVNEGWLGVEGRREGGKVMNLNSPLLKTNKLTTNICQLKKKKPVGVLTSISDMSKLEYIQEGLSLAYT